jgi:hypothetical protein
MTRGVGAVLVPTLAVEAIQQYWLRRCWNWRWLWIAIVPTGFVVYLLINSRVAGHPFAFLQTRKVSFEQSFALPSAGIRQAIWALYPSAREAEMVGRQELFFVALGFVCTIVSWIKLRPAYATWMTGNLILFTSVNFLQSIPRYTLTMFPILSCSRCLLETAFWPAYSRSGHYCFSRCLPCYLSVVNGHSENPNDRRRCEIAADPLFIE